MESKINLLDIHVANLIAAGEVVDRPSSALKELIENSIDAGASVITAEIKSGGIIYMRVTDNGSGMNAEDLGRSVLRHATSKIKDEKDLAKINTLGFRGEALAAISSVTDMKIFTKTKESQTGYMLESSSGHDVKISEAGCANGTTIVIEKLFSKVPARQKFLKREATEGMYCKWITEKMALSNPSVSFKFIQDGKQKIFTPGNGSPRDTIYSIFGDEVADNMLCIENTENAGDMRIADKVSVSGFLSKIEDGRKNRADENFFVNGRYVYSKTIMSALEEAYKSISEVSATAGKFPFCVLYIYVDESKVDINVHPQKMEIKFSDERQIYSSVYYAVKTALNKADYSVGTNILSSAQSVRPRNNNNIGVLDGRTCQNADAVAFRTFVPTKTAENAVILKKDVDINNINIPIEYKNSEKSYQYKEFRQKDEINVNPNNSNNLNYVNTSENKIKINIFDKDTESNNNDNNENKGKYNYKLVGEIFYGYIIVEKDDKIIIIDKHAAHERIIYDIILKRSADANSNYKTQILLVPIEVKLNPEEAAGIIDIENDMKKMGIIFEWESDGVILITEVPYEIADVNIEEIIKEAAYMSFEGNLSAHETAFEKLAELTANKYAACRAAMKSGIRDSVENIIWLADRIMNYEDVKYCPHGRPVAFETTKYEIEKRFKR
ncbi:MAG: DNA mismatch repair endonuclease MutL [Oscillospiraceae bacterium]|nr:DNA mismatch repair endonuclease MutL [Oscillospiraceae bacterium]